MHGIKKSVSPTWGRVQKQHLQCSNSQLSVEALQQRPYAGPRFGKCR